jgi:hypothetical protein
MLPVHIVSCTIDSLMVLKRIGAAFKIVTDPVIDST